MVKMKSDSNSKKSERVAKTAVEKLAKAETEGAEEPPIDENEVILEVECGANKASLHLSKLCQGSKGPCIYFNKAWLTPNEFQYVSGRETAKDWKRSIRHFGKSIKLLMTKGTMTVDPTACECEGCTGISDDQEEQPGSPKIAKANGGAIAEQNGVKTTTQDDGGVATKKNGELTPKEKAVKPTNRKSLKNGLTHAQKKNEKKIMAEVEKKVDTEPKEETKTGPPPEVSPTVEPEIPIMDLDTGALLTGAPSDEDKPSPQKESRLNNIIEGIKTKRRDEDDPIPNERIPPAMLDDLEKRDDLDKKLPVSENEVAVEEIKKTSPVALPVKPEDMNGTPEPKTLSPIPPMTAEPPKTENMEPKPISIIPRNLSPASNPAPIVNMDALNKTNDVLPKTSDVSTPFTEALIKPPDNIPKLSDVINKFNDVIPNVAKNGIDTPKPPPTLDNISCPIKPDPRHNDVTNTLKPMDLMKDVMHGNLMNDVMHDDIRSAASILKEMLKNEAALKAAMNKTGEAESKPKPEAMPVKTGMESKTSPENNNEPRAANCTKCTEYNKISVPAPPLLARPPERTPEKTLQEKAAAAAALAPPKHSPYMGHLASHAMLAKEREAELQRARINSSPKDLQKSKTHSPISHTETRDQSQGRIYAPVTWPPVTVDSRKDEKCRRSPLASDSHKNSVSSSVTTVTSSPSAVPSTSASVFPGATHLAYGKPEAATYMEYLRSMGAAYPNLLAHPGLEGTEYLAYLRRYYEWYEYHKLYPYLVPPTPCASRMPPPVDPRAAMTSELQKQAMCLSPYSPYLYGAADPRLAGTAAAGLDLTKYMCQSTRPKDSSGPSSSTAETPNGHLTPPRVPERKRTVENENEALDLSVKKRRLAEETKTKETTLRKDTPLNPSLPGPGLPNPGLGTSLAAAGGITGAGGMDTSRLIQGTLPTHPLGLPGLPLYPPYWGLDAMQAGGMPAVTLPGLTPSQAFMSLPKDSNGLQMPLGFPHLSSAACAGTTERERLLSHLRL